MPEEIFRILEPLQCGARGKQVCVFRKMKLFGITGYEGSPLVDKVYAATLHIAAKVVKNQLFGLERLVKQTGVMSCTASEFNHLFRRRMREMYIQQIDHPFGYLLLHTGLLRIGVYGF